MTRRQRFVADCRGVSAVEFALIAPVFLTTLFFIFGICLALWTSAAIQTAASQLARCAVVGTASCVGTTNQTSYVNTILTDWGVAAFLPSPNISVTAGSTCSATAGHYTKVTISGPADAALFIALPAKTLTATACFPSGP